MTSYTIKYIILHIIGVNMYKYRAWFITRCQNTSNWYLSIYNGNHGNKLEWRYRGDSTLTSTTLV